MRENYKLIKHKSGNKKTETYQEGDAHITKHYHDAKDAYVKEFIAIENGITTIKHITEKGVVSKLEHFVNDKREGQEIKYFVSKADGSVKSTKMYKNGKLDGEVLTYNEHGEIIKHEIFALGKLLSKK